MVNHTMTKGMAATERTVEDALAHADELKATNDIYNYPMGEEGAFANLDLTVLAEEVRRLRAEIVVAEERGYKRGINDMEWR